MLNRILTCITHVVGKPGSYILAISCRQEKAHKLLTRKLFEKAVNPRTTRPVNRRKCIFYWFSRRTHKLLCSVNRPVVSGSGPSPEQMVYVYVPVSLPIHRRSAQVIHSLCRPLLVVYYCRSSAQGFSCQGSGESLRI